MSTAALALNPMLLTNAAGTFNVSSDGYIQGTEMADPSSRNWLSGGILGPNETIPMWGGVGISETTTPVSNLTSSPRRELGGYITRASQIAAGAGQLTGFSVFTQDHSMLTTPQNPVPVAGSLMSVNFYRLGTNARIPVACDPSLVSLDGNVITQQVSWDFNNQVLVPYSSSGAGIAITSMAWATTNGGQIAIVTGAAAPVGAVGDVINISGSTTTGTGGAAAVNGNFVVNTFTDNQHFTVSATLGNAAYYGTITPGVINPGSGILPCRVLDVQVGNSMTVSYSAQTGFATWNRNGSCALILI
jgi:hypothetical protein